MLARFVNDAIKQVYEAEVHENRINYEANGALEAIVQMDMDLTETFKTFDIDGDGTVDLKEAKQVLEKFDLGLSPPGQSDFEYFFTTTF